MAKKKKKKMRLALIFGGTSRERVVSKVSGKIIAKHLDPEKYDVTPIEIDKSGSWQLSSETIKQIGKEIKTKPAKSTAELVPLNKDTSSVIDVALLALHGPGGEDGTIQGMLDLFDIPYTCSGVLASSLAMDKARTKRLLASEGVPVLPHLLVKRKAYKKDPKKFTSQIKSTVVVKPSRMGSSFGVALAKNKKELEQAINEALKHDHEVIIEPYIEGREITVPVLGNSDPEVLPTIEIIPWKKSSFYDFSAKYEEGGSEHVIPAKLTKAQEKQVKELALVAHTILGCRGITRSDFMLDKKGQFFFLEINTIPGMTPTSLAPQSAEKAGINFTELLDRLIKLALKED